MGLSRNIGLFTLILLGYLSCSHVSAMTLSPVTVEDVTTASQTTTMTTTTTTLKPIELVPWYYQPILVVLLSFGVAIILLFFLCFGIKACLAAMCPKTSAKCNDYCDYDFCTCPRTGACLQCCHRNCCETKKAKRRRLRREKRRARNAKPDGEWWAYYPGVGWGPAPKDMLPEGAAAGEGGQAPEASWDQGHNYDQAQEAQGGEADGGWDAGYGYDQAQHPQEEGQEAAGWDAGYGYDQATQEGWENGQEYGAQQYQEEGYDNEGFSGAAVTHQPTA